MKVDIYKAKKGYVFVPVGQDPAKNVPADVGYGRLVKENHTIQSGGIGLPKDFSVVQRDIETKGYYHSSAGVLMGESVSVNKPLDKDNPSFP
ncbi:hypothetical protein ACK32N_07660 [Aeromonas caviae]